LLILIFRNSNIKHLNYKKSIETLFYRSTNNIYFQRWTGSCMRRQGFIGLSSHPPVQILLKPTILDVVRPRPHMAYYSMLPTGLYCYLFVYQSHLFILLHFQSVNWD